MVIIPAHSWRDFFALNTSNSRQDMFLEHRHNRHSKSDPVRAQPRHPKKMPYKYAGNAVCERQKYHRKSSALA
jgi:hypothetical protein